MSTSKESQSAVFETSTTSDAGGQKNADLANQDVATDSENERKVQLKPLESEPEHRNTSTSNAGESEYESANEEGVDFALNAIKNEPLSSNVELVVSDKRNEEHDDDDNSHSNVASNSVEEKVDSEESSNEISLEEEEDLTDNEDIENYAENNHCEEQIDSIQSNNSNGGNDVRRESCDGEESLKSFDTLQSSSRQGLTVSVKSPKSKAELAKIKRSPQYIPRKGSYFEHDDRGNDEEEKKASDAMKTIDEEDDKVEGVQTKPKKSSIKLGSDGIMTDNASDNTLKEKSDLISHSKSVSDSCPIQNENNSEYKSKPESARKKPIWDSGEKWNHDKFDLEEQKPKSREELINIYGYDIRTEMEAPRLQRRSKYGKGPQRYSRRSDDENAYAKKTIRTVIRNSNNHSRSNHDADDSPVGSKHDSSRRDRTFDKRSKSKENDRPKSITKDNGKSYNRNSDTTRFENARIFVNKSGQSSKFAHGAGGTMNAEQRSSNKGANVPNSREVNKAHENYEPNETDLNKEKEINKNCPNNQLFTNEDFPELISSSHVLKTSNSANQASSIDESASKVIYYQKPLEAESKTNDDTHADVDSNQESLTRNVNDVAVGKNKPNRQTAEPIAPVESLQFENSRHSRNKVNSYYNQSYSRNSNKASYSHAGNRKYDESISETTDESMNPKRYSSIRQQQQPRNLTLQTTTSTITTSNNNSVISPQSGTMNQITVNSAASASQFISMNNEPEIQSIVPPEEAGPKNYYDSSSVATSGPTDPTEISHATPTNMIATGTGPTPASAAYAPPMMAYYDPNSASVAQAASTATGLQAPIGLAPAYFAPDQTGAAPQNFYLTPTDLSVTYHPALASGYIQANYPQTLASHHTHQSHVANRYLNTAPAGASAESNRYLQTTPANQNSTPILMSGNLATQSYPSMSTAFPSGYPQFPTQPHSAASPLPAGYPNVQLGATTSVSSASNSSQNHTPSGYPEMCRGGITYYDIPSQQQAMQRFQQNVNQQQQSSVTNRRQTKPVPGHHPASHSGDGKQLDDASGEGDVGGSTKLDQQSSTPNNAGKEIPVNN